MPKFGSSLTLCALCIPTSSDCNSLRPHEFQFSSDNRRPRRRPKSLGRSANPDIGIHFPCRVDKRSLSRRIRPRSLNRDRIAICDKCNFRLRIWIDQWRCIPWNKRNQLRQLLPDNRRRDRSARLPECIWNMSLGKLFRCAKCIWTFLRCIGHWLK